MYPLSGTSMVGGREKGFNQQLMPAVVACDRISTLSRRTARYATDERASMLFSNNRTVMSAISSGVSRNPDSIQY